MRICITGTPGVGKTALAKRLGELLKYAVINEKEFALRERIVGGKKTEFGPETNELAVPLEKLEARLKKFLAEEKDVIFEGHMLCEVKAPFDLVVVLRLSPPERLEYRLESRGYSQEKIQDNVFCEGIGYCLKHALRNYGKKRVFEADNRKTIKGTTDLILREVFLRRGPKAQPERKKFP